MARPKTASTERWAEKRRGAQFREAFSELANALQVAAPLASKLRATFGEAHPDLATLDTALQRAMRAMRMLRAADA